MPRAIKLVISREIIPDDDADLSYLEQDYSDCPPDEAAQYREGDAQRLRDYGNTWSMIGVRAKGELQIPYGPGGTYILQTIHSPGVWGVEDDSGEEYLNELYAEEKATLLSMLATFKECSPEVV